ncbi:hypothetical protein Plec18167_007294 [Paecilomyces lecythidis]|uniref:NADH dehydrogenase [ubiquinone] 1 alpha subcomplex subunit 1 n=1 Tax=Paecilomyces lecythidis TaxID=3004212 RepID=A0ABR3X5N0_9EURO
MFGVTGAGLTVSKYLSNEHKKARWNRDAWDRVSAQSRIALVPYTNAEQQMQERDYRLTGSLRTQSAIAEAPKGFEVSNPWKLEKRIF